MKNKKLMLGIIVVVLVIVIGTLVGVLMLKAPEPDYENGYTLYELDIDMIQNEVPKINSEDNIDIYLVDDFIKDDDIKEPLVTKTKVYALRDENGKNVDDITSAATIVVYMPDNSYSVLKKSELLGNIKLKVEKIILGF